MRRRLLPGDARFSNERRLQRHVAHSVTPLPSGSLQKRKQARGTKACAELSRQAGRACICPHRTLRAQPKQEPGVPLKLSGKGESCVSLPLFRLLQRLLRLRSLRALRKCERKAKNKTNPHAQLREIRNRTAETLMVTGFPRVDQCVHRARKKRRIPRRCSADGAVKYTNVTRFSRIGFSVSARWRLPCPDVRCCRVDRGSPAKQPSRW